MGSKFTNEKGLNPVTFSTADGAPKAAPAMGIADAIVDLVGSGTTSRENNLKEIAGGVILQSQAVLVASRKSLTQEVAERVLSRNSLSGLQGPAVSPVFCKRNGQVTADYYAIVICVLKKAFMSLCSSCGR
ncbi:unnamed protein product [Cuscuta campestris]|uniref:ATP phosphoribosyltransferase n=1 Tax=Cuscuta campestris TaxID=132261 RepID=A0A484NDY7_9ASTE|nr:unnamed protein product [Cuscuta campestris]